MIALMQTQPAGRSIPAWLSSATSDCAVPAKKFKDHFKLIRNFDDKSTVLLVKNYENGKIFTAVRTQIENNQAKAEHLFAAFERDKKLLEELNLPFVLRLLDFFVDPLPETSGLLNNYLIFEQIEYPLFNSNQTAKINLVPKHVVKHFDENEILRILLDLIVFFRSCEVVGRRPLISTALVCYSNSQYRLMVRGFEEREQGAGRKAFRGLFEEEEKETGGEDKISRAGINKLDIQKSSHRTTDSLTNLEEPEEKSAEQATSNVECSLPKSQSSLTRQASVKTDYCYQFSVSLCNGFFRDMASALFGVGIEQNETRMQTFTAEHFSKFSNLLEAFRVITADLTRSVTCEQVDHWIEMITSQLNRFFNLYFSFKNQEVLLLDQPIFSKVKRLTLELAHDLSNPGTYVKFIAKELRRMPELEMLDLSLNDCVVNFDELSKILESLVKMKRLNKLILKLSHNNLQEEFVGLVAELLDGRALETLDLSLCE